MQKRFDSEYNLRIAAPRWRRLLKRADNVYRCTGTGSAKPDVHSISSHHFSTLPRFVLCGLRLGVRSRNYRPPLPPVSSASSDGSIRLAAPILKSNSQNKFRSVLQVWSLAPPTRLHCCWRQKASRRPARANVSRFTVDADFSNSAGGFGSRVGRRLTFGPV
jgi:hypothetical protein